MNNYARTAKSSEHHKFGGSSTVFGNLGLTNVIIVFAELGSVDKDSTYFSTLC